MKMLRFTLFALALAVAAPITTVEAIVSSQSTATEIAAASEPTLTKKQQRQLDRLEKKLAKAEARAAEKSASAEEKVDFEDPINKWMWFWIFGWSAAIIFSILGYGVIGGLYYIGYLCGLFGTVSLIIWLLKKSGSI